MGSPRPAAEPPSAPPPRPGPEEPRRRHGGRRDARRADLERLEARGRHLALIRLLVFLAGAVVGWAVLDPGLLASGWLLLPLAVFGAVAVWHDRVIRAQRDAGRAVDHHERCLRRVDERWRGEGPEGCHYADPDHPYASDLDLFGDGSLFQRLCTARTQPGQQTLARWLRRPASSQEVRARQAAVRELAPGVELRERLALAGREAASVDPVDLARWARAPARFGETPRVSGLRWTGAALVGIQIAALVGWLTLGWPRLLFLLALAGQGLFGLWLRKGVRDAVHRVEEADHQLELLEGILREMEATTFDSPRLAALQESLCLEGPGDATRPSEPIAALRRLVVLLDSRDNMFFAPFGLLLLWSTQLALATESWRLSQAEDVPAWLEAVGEFEALVALSAYGFERPADVFPELVDAGTVFAARDLGHPLLPRDRRVCNDLDLGDQTRLVVVSGSNMSGKSTLLRTVGVNAVLAQAGAPVCASHLRIAPLLPGASIQVVDSLQEGVSGFYAEIRKLRTLVELASGDGPPLLFLLDEIMARTNSHDRRIGAEAVLRSFLERGAFGLVTTHDLALTRLADDLGEHAANVHFVDHLEDGRIRFDYRLRPGVVQRSNAVELMRSVGLDV